jgi:AcrR family transcriptional regulator
MINSMARRAHAEVSPRSRQLLLASATATSPGTSQRRRLLGAMTDLAISDGYASVTVGQVVALAGVSRATFYQHFIDIEACFTAALAPIRQRLLVGIRSSVASDRPEHATRRATHALFAFAGSRPAMARLLMGDSLTGGSRLRRARDEFVDDAARIIEDAHGRAGSGTTLPELPPTLLIGASCRLIASRLYEGEPHLGGLRDELLGWIAAYEMPVAGHSWRALTALPPAPSSPFLPPGALCRPPVPAPGRTRLKADALAESHWLRIVFATAETIRHDGYSAATVTHITDVAGLDARAFYRLFTSKQQALVAGCELLFRHAIAAAAGAFAVGADWPERLWEAARALTQFADANPTLTYVALVESPTGGSSAMRRAEDLTRAFTIFLQDGFAQPSSDSAGTVCEPSGLALEAIGTAVFELAYRHAREAGEVELSTLLAPIVFISLAPFLGPETAAKFACRQTPDAETPLANAA